MRPISTATAKRTSCGAVTPAKSVFGIRIRDREYRLRLRTLELSPAAGISSLLIENTLTGLSQSGVGGFDGQVCRPPPYLPYTLHTMSLPVTYGMTRAHARVEAVVSRRSDDGDSDLFAEPIIGLANSLIETDLRAPPKL